jgi:NAD(P)-dependent dehydrogenase (short-subunit alcohol dehydrogenase family)
VYATSGAGHGALFRGWGFYGMSKAAVEFEIKQLEFEEPEVTSIGVSPGLCDTKMADSLRAGGRKLIHSPQNVWNLFLLRICQLQN